MAFRVGLKQQLAELAKGSPVTIDVIEVPPVAPRGLVFVVYEQEVMSLPQLERYALMARLQKMQEVVGTAGLRSKLLGRSERPEM